MEKRNSRLEYGQPMEQTRRLFCTCDSGVARCQSQNQYHIRLAPVSNVIFSKTDSITSDG